MDHDLTSGTPDATPLDDGDLDGLIPAWVATRSDLDAAEQANIEQAALWAFGRRRVVADPAELLTVPFANRVHRRMFGDVWRWAGTFRQRITNIGVEPYLIPQSLRDALDDATYWHRNDVFGATEIAVRLHHRVVTVHPYPNGNGRHSRFMADLYLHVNGMGRLGWGGGRLEETGNLRAEYVAALREADAGSYESLIRFAVG